MTKTTTPCVLRLSSPRRWVRVMNLTGLAPELDTICAHAIKERLTYPAFLTHALNIEIDIRHERRRQRRVLEESYQESKRPTLSISPRTQT